MLCGKYCCHPFHTAQETEEAKFLNCRVSDRARILRKPVWAPVPLVGLNHCGPLIRAAAHLSLPTAFLAHHNPWLWSAISPERLVNLRTLWLACDSMLPLLPWISFCSPHISYRTSHVRAPSGRLRWFFPYASSAFYRYLTVLLLHVLLINYFSV